MTDDDRHPLISGEALANRLAGESPPVVVDCRFALSDPDAGLKSYKQGHIPGAVYAHLDDDLAAPPGPGTGRHPLPLAATLRDTLRRLGIDDDTQVVVYDDAGGAIAARLWWLLRYMGHERNAVLDGGISSWTSAGGELAAGEPPDARLGSFSGMPDEALVASTAELEGGTVGNGICLLDARSGARFRGEEEPIDAVAGHVPCAVSLPFNEQLDAEGRFLDRDALRQVWKNAANGAGAEHIVMCGSGVTACHLALGALLAGHSMPRVYVGSWSEWIADPERPVAAGEG